MLHQSFQIPAIQDFEQLKLFQISFKQASSVQARVQCIMALTISSQEIVNKFAASNGFRVLAGYLKEALKNLPQQEELLDKIMTFLLKVQLNEDMVRESEIASPLLKMKDKKYANNIRNKDLYENISNNWSRYYSKNRHYLEGWEQNKSHKKKYEEPVKKKVKRSSSSGSVKKQKKKVKFAREDQLLHYKIFKRDDEPNQRGMTQEEVLAYQRIYAEELKRMATVSAYDLKHRESQMEGRFSKQVLDNVSQMMEQIPHTRAFRLRLLHDTMNPEFVSSELEYLKNRAEKILQTHYRNEAAIPAEPGYGEISKQNAPAQMIKVIHLDPPKREDLMYMVNVMCSKAMKELQDKRSNFNKKPLKGILKKAPEEHMRQKDAIQQVRQDLQPIMKQLMTMIDKKNQYSQENIRKNLQLLHEIIQKLKELKEPGSEQYIQNVKQIIENKLTNAANSDDPMARWKDECNRKRLDDSQQITRLRPYKTKPCHNYHSSRGCTRGEACNFIHDPKFQGLPIPTTVPPISNLPNLFQKSALTPQLIQSLLPNTPHWLQQLNPSTIPTNRYNRKYESL